MRRIVFAAVALVCLGVLLFAFFRSFDRKDVVQTEPLTAIPQDAGLIFESNQIGELWRDLSDKSLIWEALQVSDFYFRLNVSAESLDSLLRLDQDLRSLLANSPAVISAHKTGAGEIDFLLVVPLVDDFESTDLLKNLGELLRQKGETPYRDFQGQRVYTIENTWSDRPIYTFVADRLLVLSFSPVLIESSARALDNGQSIWTDATFRTLRDTRGEQSRGQLYTQYSRLSEMVEPFAVNPDLKDPFYHGQFADWSALDIRVDADALLLNGFAAVNDTSNQWLNLFKATPAVSPVFFEYMPEETVSFAFFGFDSISAFLHRRDQLIGVANSSTTNQTTKALKDSCQCNLETLATAWIADQMLIMSLPPKAGDSLAVEIAFFRSKDQALASESLLFLTEALTEAGRSKPETYLNRAIMQLPLSDFYGARFGGFFDAIRDPYYTFIDDIVIMSGDLSGIKSAISAVEREKTLEKSAQFASISNQMGHASNFILYHAPAQSSKLIENWLKPPYRALIAEQSTLLKQFPGWFYQLAHHKDNLFYNSTYLQYAPYQESDSPVLWETQLKSSVLHWWNRFENHNTGSTEILVQDSLYRLYLISASGKVYWEKELDGEIIGAISKIDALKNRKWQMVFNTANTLYALDRNGQPLDHFPVALQTPTDLPVSIVDYDGDRTYRFFIADREGGILPFDGNGKALKGWEFKSQAKPITAAVQHIRIRNKDYLFAIQDSSAILLLDRRGDMRLKVEALAPSNLRHSPVIYTANDIKDAGFYSVDGAGNGMKLNFGGKPVYTLLNIGMVATDRVAMYQHQDKLVTAVSSGEEIHLFSGGNFKSVRSLEIAGNLDLAWQAVGKALYLTAFDRSTGMAYVFTEKGEMLPGFPTESSTATLILAGDQEGIRVIISDASGRIKALPL